MPAMYLKIYPPFHNKLKVLQDVGMGYLGPFNPPTLSGGEAQRIQISKRKLANMLKHFTCLTTTTGLHFDDINRLLSVLQQLVDQGNTVIVIEHNLDIIKCDILLTLGQVVALKVETSLLQPPRSHCKIKPI